VRYGFALVVVAVCVVALLWMTAVFESAAHVSLFLCAVMLSAWFGGFTPGLFATGLSVLALTYYFVPPTHSLDIDPRQVPRLVLFALCGLFVTWLTAAQRTTAELLARARDDLEERSAELERINAALQTENVERTRAEYVTGQVFESLPDGVAIVGTDYRYQRVNPVYERYFRVPAGKIVGMRVADLVGAEVFEITRAFLDRCFAGEEVRNAGWWLNNVIGRRYMGVTYSPLRPHADRVEAALVISRDLTEHILASEALRETQAELTHVARVTTLGEVTGSFAHELNQPLAAIVNNASACLGLLRGGRPDLDEVRGALGDIVTDAERASAIIERVGRLAKRSSPERVRLRLADVVADVVALAAAESAARRVAIRTDVPATLPVVAGDRVQLQQVLLNLVVNGMDAMSGLDEPDRRLEIRGCEDVQDGVPVATISVRDCGIGLQDGQADRLFEAFYTTKPHGMGLGLAISRSIIEAHGGRLWAESNPGPGATFSFRLPTAARSATG
jgi:signal transduction histidine kinase